MKSYIKVGVRVRPPLPREIESGEYHKCVAIKNNASGDSQLFISTSGKPMIISAEALKQNQGEALDDLSIYSFNKIFDTDTAQDTVYNSMIEPVVQSVVQQGLNACVFAYGQTGSGKTYTMYGSGEKASKPLIQMTEDEINAFQGFGMAQRAIIEVFQTLYNKDTGSASQINFQEEEKQNNDDDQIMERQDSNEDVNDIDSDGTETTIGDLDRQISIFVSIYQIYNENVNDLLRENTGKNLDIRQDSRKNFYVQGMTQVLVSSPKDVFKLIKKALSKRTAAATGMNDFSSRSHLVLQMTINQVDERDMSATVSKLNIVDLAGSERVKDSGVSGQGLTEAANINKSLFHLISVVNDLKVGKKPNYRNSALTKLLSDSIGGNCMTTLLAMVSPSQQFCKESNNTLNFADSCSQVSNVVKPNKYKGTIPSSVPVAHRKQKAIVKAKIPWKNGQSLQDIQNLCEPVMIDTKNYGKVFYMKAGSDEWQNKIILLHGCPSSSQEFLHQIPAYLFCEYQVYAVDLPGYGHSTGQKMKSKSSEVLTQGGPADFIQFFIQNLGLNQKGINLCLGGYDWGAGISLKMGVKYQKQFKKIIALLPSYNEEERDELKKLKLPTLIQWVKQDQLHNWTKWKPLANKIPNATVDVFDIGKFQPGISAGTYSAISDKVTTSLVKFLTGVDYLNPNQEVFQAKKEKGKDTRGQNITQIDTLILQDDLSAQQMQAMTQKPDVALEAVNQLMKIVQKEGFAQLRASRASKTHPQHDNVKRLIDQLPDFDVDSPDPTEFLVDYGIWSQSPANHEQMLASPRYFPGRMQVLAKYFVESANPLERQKYMKMCPAEQAASNEKFVTHKASILDIQGDQVTLADPTDPAGTEKFVVPLGELETLNQPHVFAKDILGNLVFEDGLKCSYKNKNTKLILYQIAFALAPLIAKLDFSTDDIEVIQNNLQVQLECIRAIRSCLDIVTFNKGSEKIVIAEREKVGDVGLTGLFGQGNCHGCSSTMAAYLYPFQNVLGIDLKYRGGYSFSGSSETVRNEVERHQWLEVTCRPSMESFTCDLWYEGVNDEPSYLTMPINMTYSQYMYPNGKLILNSRSKKNA